MSLSRGRSALLIALATAALTGCGGSRSATSETTDTVVPTHRTASDVDRGLYIAKAEAICRRGLRKTHALGRNLPEVLSSSASPQEGITNGLVRPGTEILSREAAGLRNIRPAPNSRALEIYLGLFEPIVELAHQRLEAGTAGELERAHNLELMIASLGDEQSAAAHQFGLHACSVKFTRALGGLG